MSSNPTVILEKHMDENGLQPKVRNKVEVVWLNVLIFTIIHFSGLYGLYLAITSASLKTSLFCLVAGYLGSIGITAGTHRLWSHRSYKAKLPLRILYCIFTCIAAQNNIYVWSRDHRVHHKYAETDADPHNIKRGFFFAHMGWLLCKKLPIVVEKGKKINLDDLMDDPVVRFQRKYYIPMVMVFGVFIPAMIPVWFWGETIWNSLFVAVMWRYIWTLHCMFLVNSAAHYFGERPFNKSIESRESLVVTLIGIGEGFHNYHHTFSWDYAASELGCVFNLSTVFIDFMALLGLAYDLKTVHPDVVEKKKLKSGDGTRLKQTEFKADERQKIS